MIMIQLRVRGYSRKTRPSFTALLFSLIANDIFFPLLFISSISVGTLLNRSTFFPACKSAGRFSSKSPVCHSLIDGNGPLDHCSFYLLGTPACPFHSCRTVRIGERAVAAAAAAKAGILFLFFRMIVMTDFFIHNFPFFQIISRTPRRSCRAARGAKHLPNCAAAIRRLSFPLNY